MNVSRKDALGFRDQLLELLNRLTVGTIEPHEQQRLEEILQVDPEARQAYFAFMDLDQGLRSLQVNEALGWSPPNVLTPTATRHDAGASWLGYVATAILAVAATLLSVSLLSNRGDRPEPQPR